MQERIRTGLELMRQCWYVNWLNWPLSGDDAEFWQDVGVADAGGVGRNGMQGWRRKPAEPDPGICAWQSS